MKATTAIHIRSHASPRPPATLADSDRAAGTAARLPTIPTTIRRIAAPMALALTLASPRTAWCAPVQTSWPVDGPDDSAAVACSRLSGIYVVCDAYENNVEIRDIRTGLLRKIDSSEILALLPWMSFSGGPDGPSGVAVSDSGRLVFVLVHDDLWAGDGEPSDGVILYDTWTNQLSLFARLDLFNRGDSFPLLAAAHHKGRLYAGTTSQGVHVFAAGISDAHGTLLSRSNLPDGSAVRGLAIDPDHDLLYAASPTAIYRAPLGSSPLDFELIGNVPNMYGIAFSAHYGGPANAGLYLLTGTSGQRVIHVPAAQARGFEPFDPGVYVSTTAASFDIAATACGRLLCGASEDGVMIADNSDTRMQFDDWLWDEFDQLVAFAKSLVAPDGEGPGWVIDADVQLGWSRFHPASPDAASEVIMVLLLAAELRHDPQAQPLVRDILVRYAGLATDGIVPEKTADGTHRHWYDPATGGLKGVWDPEFATLSRMKLEAAAVRARQHFWSDPVIRQAADAILAGGTARTAYLDQATGNLYFRALPGGGPDLSLFGKPFFEGIMFAELAAAFDAAAEPLYARWLDASQWPTAELVPGYPVNGNSAGEFQAAFVSLVPFLLQRDFRESLSWQASVRNLFYSHAAWVDANGPRYFTVFSAGTTKPEWAASGYHADSLTVHPGDIATFPSLLAFCADGGTIPAVAAYHAYRRGARQTFAGGASILYRRSNDDPAWQPNSAGLPDVALGAIGLAALLQPGTVETNLTLDLSGDGLALRPHGDQMELSWPLVGGWRIEGSTDLASWHELGELPNPYRFVAAKEREFFRIVR